MGIKPLRAGKRQLRTLQVADGCGLSAWSKLPRRVCRPLRATNGIFDTDKSRWLWPECLVQVAAERLHEAFEGGQTAASNADSSRWLWPACLVENAAERLRPLGKRQPRTPIVYSRWLWPECLVEGAAERFRPLRASKRQPRTPIVADGCGLRAWSKLPRMGIKPLRAGKRQPRTPIVADGSGLSACWLKLPRNVLGL